MVMGAQHQGAVHVKLGGVTWDSQRGNACMVVFQFSTSDGAR